MGAVDQTDGGGDPPARDGGVETRAGGAFVVMDALRCVLAVTVDEVRPDIPDA